MSQVWDSGMLHLGFSRDFTIKITTSVERLYPKSAVLRTDDVLGCRMSPLRWCVIMSMSSVSMRAQVHTHTHTHTCTICTIDQFGFKNIISLHPQYLGGFQEHDKRWVFQSNCFSKQEQVHAWVIASSFVCSWKPPGIADAMHLKPNWSIHTASIHY